MEGRFRSDAVSREQFQYLTGFFHVLIGFLVALQEFIPRRHLGLLAEMPDVVQQAVDQVVVQTLGTVEGKAQQVHIHLPNIHAVELVNRIVPHQRGIVFHALPRNPHARQQPLG